MKLGEEGTCRDSIEHNHGKAQLPQGFAHIKEFVSLAEEFQFGSLTDDHSNAWLIGRSSVRNAVRHR